MAFGLSAIIGALKAVGGIVDSIHTSDEERLKLKNAFAEMQAEVLSNVIEYQKALNESQAKVITAEAAGGSWIQKSWRPITMLVFVALIVARWFGLATDRITAELELELFSIIKIGIGGYIGGRSLEKIVQVGAGAMKDYANTRK